jgi:hypothetical protein
MKTIKRILWAALLIAIVGTMLTTCHSCGKKEDKKPTPALTAKQLELNKLQNDKIVALQKQVTELSERPATVATPSATPSLPGIFQVNRFTPVDKDTPQIRDLKNQIWKLEADISISKTRRLMGPRGGEESNIALANIRAMNMTLTDMKTELARLQSQ